MTALREIVPETRTAAQAIKRLCSDKLDRFHLQQLYGCGVEGCVYKSGTDRAVKLSLNEEEARAARWVQELGSERPPALPVIYEVRSLESCATLKAYLIEREDLRDLHAADPRLVNSALTAVETATAFSADQFAQAERQRAAGAVRLLGSYIGIARKDSWIVRQLYTFTLWCIEHGVAFLDLHTQNLGVRSGERQVVIRDFGHSDIPEAPREVALAGSGGHKARDFEFRVAGRSIDRRAFVWIADAIVHAHGLEKNGPVEVWDVKRQRRVYSTREPVQGLSAVQPPRRRGRLARMVLHGRGRFSKVGLGA